MPPHVVRLETTADVRGDGHDRRISISARHEAVLDDGRRVLLLDDRGWAEELRGPGADDVPDIWAGASADDIAKTARDVVGPDEPFGDRSYEDMAVGHWATLAERIRAQGVSADADELRALPHDVVLSDRLLARLGRSGERL